MDVNGLQRTPRVVVDPPIANHETLELEVMCVCVCVSSDSKNCDSQLVVSKMMNIFQSVLGTMVKLGLVITHSRRNEI